MMERSSVPEGQRVPQWEEAEHPGHQEYVVKRRSYDKEWKIIDCAATALGRAL